MSTVELGVDACCLLNLLATNREVEIVATLNVVLVTTPQARSEVRFLAGPPDDDGEPTRVLADTTRLEEAGRLNVYTLDAAAAPAFVNAAARLRDADASVVALAASRSLDLASDDVRLRNVVATLFPTVRLFGTLQMLRRVATNRGWNEPFLREVARNLRCRGSFLPPRNDPDREWYSDLLR